MCIQNIANIIHRVILVTFRRTFFISKYHNIPYINNIIVLCSTEMQFDFLLNKPNTELYFLKENDFYIYRSSIHFFDLVVHTAYNNQVDITSIC